jgi:hypothetical protein
MQNEIINIIRENIQLKTNEIIWLSEIRKFNQPTANILVLIEKIRNEKKTI